MLRGGSACLHGVARTPRGLALALFACTHGACTQLHAAATTPTSAWSCGRASVHGTAHPRLPPERWPACLPTHLPARSRPATRNANRCWPRMWTTAAPPCCSSWTRRAACCSTPARACNACSARTRSRCKRWALLLLLLPLLLLPPPPSTPQLTHLRHLHYLPPRRAAGHLLLHASLHGDDVRPAR